MAKKNQVAGDPATLHRTPGEALTLAEALLPVVALVGMLAFNVHIFGNAALDGSNQFILLLGGGVAALVGFRRDVPYARMLEEVADNIKTTTGALLILLMTGALSGTWMLSGIIPTMTYYGLLLLNPTVFLAASVVICAIISVATGSSWTTSATVGIALIGIGNALEVSEGMTAGAVISGAYFGDKLSPLSDTTNLAPAMAGGELFAHIRYLTLTTVPTLLITLLAFVAIGLTLTPTGTTDPQALLRTLEATFAIDGWLLLVPVTVVLLIVRKAPPLLALLVGTLLGGLFAVLFQPQLVANAGGSDALTFESGYRGVMNAITVDTAVVTDNATLNELFTSGGMAGMLGTVWLIICAMVFGGIMGGIGALATISRALLRLATTTFGLFASTVASCLTLNLTASDQYLALVIPGKMFAQAYRDRGLAPENLSRTLEDSGTVTSALVPWNTCGAYQSSVLGVDVGAYFVYAIFNWLSPMMTLLFAAFRIKIKALDESATLRDEVYAR
jgi:NhaC family Na+:H+ antiporter